MPTPRILVVDWVQHARDTFMALRHAPGKLKSFAYERPSRSVPNSANGASVGRCGQSHLAEEPVSAFAFPGGSHNGAHRIMLILLDRKCAEPEQRRATIPAAALPPCTSP